MCELIDYSEVTNRPKTVPHQRLIKIHREALTENFLGIKNENWKAASRDLGHTALRLYLYLAANADKYNLALSPAAIENEIGMPRSTYSDQFKKLLNKGYIVHKGGNQYEFFEKPQDISGDISKVQTDDGFNWQ